FVPGPRDDWFAPAALAALSATAYEVTTESNRVGVRLRGEALERSVRGELPSEGLARGSIQVPPSGQPVVFLADHPVTGGYPVIGVVVDRNTDLVGQLRPGQRVRFAAT
ncbi:MAG: biotin-dependent carboxyltransferase family protein, partial [Actinomycetota bacterium]|nr:biotin-dependent carboxyltransferase family protein [Actinomycetota bacterium]